MILCHGSVHWPGREFLVDGMGRICPRLIAIPRLSSGHGLMLLVRRGGRVGLLRLRNDILGGNVNQLGILSCHMLQDLAHLIGRQCGQGCIGRRDRCHQRYLQMIAWRV